MDNFSSKTRSTVGDALEEEVYKNNNFLSCRLGLCLLLKRLWPVTEKPHYQCPGKKMSPLGYTLCADSRRYHGHLTRSGPVSPLRMGSTIAVAYYIPGPEEPQSPPPLDFVPEPMYPEYIPQEDEILPAEEQPLPAAALTHISDLPGYSDYPADRDDDDDDDDDDDEDEDEDKEEEEEETDRPEITLPPRKRLDVDLGPRYEIGESLAAATTRMIGGRRVDYGFVGTMDTKIRRQRAEEVGYGIRDVWVDPREAIEEVVTLGSYMAYYQGKGQLARGINVAERTYRLRSVYRSALAPHDATQEVADDTITSGNGCQKACARNALTWWNSHVKTTTPEAAHAMPWRTLKKMMTDKYCPRGEIKKFEFEMWNLKVKGNDVVTYSQHFQELALMCDRMFPEEIDQVEKYVGGFPDTIHGSVIATKPKTMQDAIEFATELMDNKINT
ncbi:reverse transcriptase domain-containing protein [Tanacetum coccineum]